MYKNDREALNVEGMDWAMKGIRAIDKTWDTIHGVTPPKVDIQLSTLPPRLTSQPDYQVCYLFPYSFDTAEILYLLQEIHSPGSLAGSSTRASDASKPLPPKGPRQASKKNWSRFKNRIE